MCLFCTLTQWPSHIVPSLFVMYSLVDTKSVASYSYSNNWVRCERWQKCWPCSTGTLSAWERVVGWEDISRRSRLSLVRISSWRWCGFRGLVLSCFVSSCPTPGKVCPVPSLTCISSPSFSNSKLCTVRYDIAMRFYFQEYEMLNSCPVILWFRPIPRGARQRTLYRSLPGRSYWWHTVREVRLQKNHTYYHYCFTKSLWIWVWAEKTSQHRYRGVVSAKGDPGYKATAMMVRTLASV